MADNILAIIPARGGSKRLPGKNIKELDGRPLIAYSILAAKVTSLINHVCVATDSDVIWDESEWYHPDIITRLPKEVTTDTAPLTNSLKHVLEFLNQYGHRTGEVDWIVLLQPTCPLRQPSLIDRWIQQVLNMPNCDGGLTVDRGGYKLGFCSGDGWFVPEYVPMTPKAEANKRKARENGVFYMFKAGNILKGKPWGKCPKMIPLECPPDQSVANVDNQIDWDIMEFLYFKRGYDKMFKELENG